MAKDDFEEKVIDYYLKKLKARRQLINSIESGEYKKKILKEVFDLESKDYKKIYRKAVDKFYNQYEPDYYDRLGSLYHMFSFSVDDDDIYIEESPEFAQDINIRDADTQHRVDKTNSDYIYDKMFVEGWHGGATPTDKLDYFRRPYPPGFEMAYRTPTEEIPRGFKKNGTPRKPLPRFALWSMRPVAKSKSPQQIADEETEKYERGEPNYSGNIMDKQVSIAMRRVIQTYDLLKLKFQWR